MEILLAGVIGLVLLIVIATAVSVSGIVGAVAAEDMEEED